MFASNFLVPNGTIIVELVLFIIVLGTVAKFILPPIQKAMDERETTIRSALTASDEGHHEAARLVKERLSVLEQAHNEARSIIEEATATANAAFEQSRTNAQTEHERLMTEARTRIASERAQLREASLVRLGDLVAQAASQVIGAPVASSKHQQLISDLAASSRTGSEG